MRKSGEEASAPAHFLVGSGCDGLRFGDLHQHHLHRDDRVVHEQAQRDDQRAQRDAVEVDAHQRHGEESDAERQPRGLRVDEGVEPLAECEPVLALGQHDAQQHRLRSARAHEHARRVFEATADGGDIAQPQQLAARADRQSGCALSSCPRIRATANT